MWTRQARTSRLVLFNTSHKHTKITRPPRRVPHVTRARSPFLPVRRRRVRSSLRPALALGAALCLAHAPLVRASCRATTQLHPIMFSQMALDYPACMR